MDPLNSDDMLCKNLSLYSKLTIKKDTHTHKPTCAKTTPSTHTHVFSIPLSEARDEKPLVVEILSSSCCERLSLISLTKEKPVENGPGAEEVEGWEKRLLEGPKIRDEASSGGKWRWERFKGGRDSTCSWKFREALLVEGSVKQRKQRWICWLRWTV